MCLITATSSNNLLMFVVCLVFHTYMNEGILQNKYNIYLMKNIKIISTKACLRTDDLLELNVFFLFHAHWKIMVSVKF